MGESVHIAIIPDGNRRWAIAKGKRGIEGHRSAVKKTIKLALEAKDDKDFNVRFLTLWGFSTENWKRSDEEVDTLMTLFYEGLKQVKKDFINKKIGFRSIGRLDRIPKKLVKLIKELEDLTKEFTDFVVCIGIDYGGRDEIIRAVNKAVKLGQTITESAFSTLLDTKGIPEPDIVIRTGGEKRFSGFLPWQAVYSELFFINEPYPEISITKLKDILNDFYDRTRTFGGTANKVGYEKYK